MLLRCDISLTGDWRNQNLPIPIYDFMARWERKAAEAMKTYEFQWPAKLVETQFIYEGKSYSITPGTFGIPNDLCEIFQTNGMDDDLRTIPGVQNVMSCGFLD
jgi:hypothetical protein